jgi:hypothetical protein
MRPGRPKQHVHNWKTKSYHKTTLGTLWGRPDFWGFTSFLYWACIRGNKVKHIYKYNREGTFITASGIMPEGWVDEEFARRTSRK